MAKCVMAEEAATYLKHSLPHISRLAIECIYIDGPFTGLLNDRILHCYLPQVDRVNNVVPIGFESPAMPDSLVDINLCLKPMELFWCSRSSKDKMKSLFYDLGLLILPCQGC